MRFVDEYRDPGLARALARSIAAHPAPAEPLRIMEICGGHTHAIYRFGVHDFLPDWIDLVHGPGCPVCVIPMGRVDDAIALATREDVILTCFGDMLRVPGSTGSFQDAAARGADVRMVYSPLDALRVAREHPDRQVVFFAIGFETTAPSTALTILRAEQEGLTNFSVICNHVRLIPALEAILAAPDLRVDAFIGPGHVSAVIGSRPYDFIAAEHGKPVVVAGFEPLDVLEAIAMIADQAAEGRCEVENQYARVVATDGNPRALAVLGEAFVHRETFEWRGLGMIPDSAFALSERYATFDAERRFALPGVRVEDPGACQCGEVLRGALRPWQCQVFGTACTPERPIGTCMVSSEGACAAYYHYGRYAAPRSIAPSRSTAPPLEPSARP